MQRTSLSPDEIAAFEPDVKVGLLATLDPGGRPHISLITSLNAKDDKHLMFGQFTEGMSKLNLRERPEAGFVVMTMDRKLWRGRARWTHAETDGPDYELYNQKPMFRYNAYFGIHTVHHLDLVSVSEKKGLPLGGLAAGLPATALKSLFFRDDSPSGVLNSWSLAHLKSPGCLKFFAWVGENGYPDIVPVVPASTAGRDRLVFAPSVYKTDFKGLQAGTEVAVFGVNLQTESVLVRGTFKGFTGHGPSRLGTLDLDWVYNSMPPTPGQIHPPVPLSPVTAF
jgi:uncharacterized pyridoxamine 5'-phosphate oxidase family protein